MQTLKSSRVGWWGKFSTITHQLFGVFAATAILRLYGFRSSPQCKATIVACFVMNDRL